MRAEKEQDQILEGQGFVAPLVGFYLDRDKGIGGFGLRSNRV